MDMMYVLVKFSLSVLFLSSLFSLMSLYFADVLEISNDFQDMRAVAFLKEREDKYSLRREHLSLECAKYGDNFNIPFSTFGPMLRFNKKHDFIYCENYKIGSTTWAAHLIALESGESKDHEFMHKEAVALNPSPSEDTLGKNSFKFFFVRDPFERLLSTYKDKIGKEEIKSDGDPVKWKSYGVIQEWIFLNKRKQYWKEGKNVATISKIPLFEDFIAYLVWKLPKTLQDVITNGDRINYHWRPIYLNCNPCFQSYDMIGKMETFKLDSYYVKKKLGIDINLELEGNRGTAGRTSTQETFNAFKKVNSSLMDDLLKIYGPDFNLFGYDYTKYQRK